MKKHCVYCARLVMRLPCPCGGHKRNKQIAKQVIARDGKCWRCGATTNLDSAHIIPKVHGGPDTMQNQRAECASYNRGGRCQQ
jgi:5-methylcytosine-specific restriction endonuclease McrA